MPSTPPFRFGPFLLHPESRLFYCDGEEVSLRPKVRDALCLLVTRAGEVVTKEELIAALWGATAVTDNSLSEVVKVLRQALGDRPQRPAYIQTVHGRGFRFIAEVTTDGDGAEEPPEPSLMRPISRRLLVAFGVLTGLLVLGVFMSSWLPRRSYPPNPARLALPLPINEPVSLSTNAGPTIAISPDGTKLAYIGSRPSHRGQGAATIFIRPLDREAVTPVAEGYVPYSGFYQESGNGNIESLFFSADGGKIGFFNAGKLKTVSLRDGTETVIATGAFDPRGASTAPDGSVVFTPFPDAGLVRLRPGAAGTETLTSPDREHGEYSHRWPQVLPDGRTVVFTVWSNSGRFEDGRVEALDLTTGHRIPLVAGAGYGRYVESGHLLFMRERKLWAQRFDPRTRALAGPELPVEDDVDAIGSGAASFDVSRNGTFVWVPARFRTAGNDTLVWVGRDGKRTRVDAPAQSYYAPSIRPDGKKVALGAGGPFLTDLWLLDVERESLERLTQDGRSNAPIFTPDGKSVVYSSGRDIRGVDLWTLPVDGSGPARPLVTSNFDKWPNSFSPNGRFLAYTESREDEHRGTDILVYDFETGESRPFLHSPAYEMDGEFSPDGRFLAFHSTEAGFWDVYIVRFPSGADKIRLTGEGGGGWPVWSPDGKEILYRNNIRQADVIAVPLVESDGGLRPGKPHKVLDDEEFSRWMRPTRSYALTPDGKELFFVATPGGVETADRVNLVLGWFDWIERSVPPAP
jgi:DNA-binding winged helix-turn-helix (wHTH) protein/WD40 repeat protein